MNGIDRFENGVKRQGQFREKTEKGCHEDPENKYS